MRVMERDDNDDQKHGPEWGDASPVMMEAEEGGGPLAFVVEEQKRERKGEGWVFGDKILLGFEQVWCNSNKKGYMWETYVQR